MELSIALATQNVETSSGGPFASLIVEIASNKILCAAVNLVVEQNQSWLHGERLAFSLGQKTLGTYNFPKGQYRLVSSAQMCIACWAESLGTGIAEIVVSATADDIEALTPFKEGILPETWREQLNCQGIKLIENVCREKGKLPLKKYGKTGPAYFDAGSKSK